MSMRPSASVDLGDQLARAITGAQFHCPVGFGGSTVGNVGLGKAAILQRLQGLVRLGQQFFPPPQQLAPEVLQHARIHERLILGRPVVWRQLDGHRCLQERLALP